MFKWIVLIKKKKGMSREQFIDYYENKHVPLIRSLLPPQYIYRRNYVILDDPMFSHDARGAGAADADFDVVTESVFATRQEAEALMTAFAQPEIFAKVKADENNFVEPGHAKMFVVEVHQSRIP